MASSSAKTSSCNKMGNSTTDLTSCIVVNYNGGDYVGRAVSSLLDQQNCPIEVIVVDNNSSDGSLRELAHLGSTKRIHLIENKVNNGFAYAVNQAISISKGKYILLLNNDAWIKSDFVTTAADSLQKNQAELLGVVMKSYDEKNILLKYGMGTDIFGHFTILRSPRPRPFYLGGCCLFFTKKMYISSGGLDSDFFLYFEEADWFWRMHLYGIEFVLESNLSVMHQYSSGTEKGLSHLRFLWRNQNCLQMLLKNYEAHNLCWILPIYFLINFIESVFFLIILKPRISLTYLEGILYNLRNIQNTLKKRRLIQKKRIRSDKYIFSKMYFGVAKFKHLLEWASPATPMG